jgi:hypothetical protein
MPRKTEEGYTYSELATTIMGFPCASQAHSMESMMAILFSIELIWSNVIFSKD